MKIILKEYLASLKERDELDKLVLPNLLSVIGLRVLNSPMRGTRQNGVDIAAVGRILDEDEKDYLYLFCIKAGNISRRNWDGGAQEVRSELNEIKDVYLRSHVAREYSSLPVKICLCFGGELEESVLANWAGYTEENSTDSRHYEEWNGDRLADLMIKRLLARELLEEAARRNFQKAVAMANEPQACYDYTRAFLLDLLREDRDSDQEQLRTLRQSCICLHAVVIWSKEIGNFEGVYRITELGVLLCWHSIRKIRPSPSPNAHDRTLMMIFDQFVSIHLQASDEYLEKTTGRHGSHLHALSVAVRSHEPIDVNLALFELLGRVAMRGIWEQVLAKISSEPESEAAKNHQDEADKSLNAIIELINSNPTLRSPIRDDHMIEIALVMYLAQLQGDESRLLPWVSEIAEKCSFALIVNSKYPTCFGDYVDLLAHPVSADQEYRDEACAGSILYPYLYLWMANVASVEEVEAFSTRLKEKIPKCTHQAWMPDEDSDEQLWVGEQGHGICITDLGPNRPAGDIAEDLNLALRTCTALNDISAMKFGLIPLLLTACRHYRFPISPAFWFLKS